MTHLVFMTLIIFLVNLINNLLAREPGRFPFCFLPVPCLPPLVQESLSESCVLGASPAEQVFDFGFGMNLSEGLEMFSSLFPYIQNTSRNPI